jgi:hypothetical protein
MTQADPAISSALEHLFPVTGAPDWDAVIASSGASPTLRKRWQLVFSVAAAAAVLASAAIAAVAILGQPAPKSVQANIHGSAVVLFPGHPGLVKATARVIAEARDATLYGISDRGGNYCIELVGAHRGLVWSFSCDLGLGANGRFVTPGAVGSDVSSIVVNGVEPPVVWWGRLATGTTKAQAVYPDGTTERIPLGRQGFFVYEPSAANQDLARQGPLTIEFLHSDGTVSLTTELLPLQPLTVLGTFSGTISGHVEIDGAAKIEIQKWNSRKPQTSYVPIKSDRTFSLPWRPNTPIDLHIVDQNGRQLTDHLNPLPESAWRSLVSQARAHR